VPAARCSDAFDRSCSCAPCAHVSVQRRFVVPVTISRADLCLARCLHSSQAGCAAGTVATRYHCSVFSSLVPRLARQVVRSGQRLAEIEWPKSRPTPLASCFALSRGGPSRGRDPMQMLASIIHAIAA